MKTRSLPATAAGFACLIVLVVGTPAHAGEIKVLSAVAMRAAIDDLAREFERSTGNKPTIVYATSGVLRDRIQGGEVFDLAILPRPAMDPLVKQGKIVPDTVRLFARSAISVAVRVGAVKPDISTVEAFKRTILAAKSISYADPAKGAAGGIHFASVLERLGIAEEVKAKSKLTPGAESVQVVARGEAEIAVANTPVILDELGVQLVGPLPEELQNTTDFVFFLGVGANAKEPETAKGFIKDLSRPEAARLIKAEGLDPG